jgi:hypothetical protein
MASCSNIPGRICPSEGLGKLSTARLMSSGIIFIQSGIPFKNCHGSRLGSKELPSRNILVHVIMLMIRVHFVIFIAVNRRRTWNTCSCFGTKHFALASMSYTISGTILRTLQKDPLYTFDILSISKKNLRYWVRYSNWTLFVHSIYIRYRSFDSISGKISYCNFGIQGHRR